MLPIIYRVVLLALLAILAKGWGFPMKLNLGTSISKRSQPLGLFMNTADQHLNIKERLTSDMKGAMIAREKVKLGAIRAAINAIKQKEVDERIEMRLVQLLLHYTQSNAYPVSSI